MPDNRAAKFEDGSIEINIDIILLCTGYAYSFPFVASIAPSIEHDGIGALPLYKHIFHMHLPTLAFVETPEKIVPFSLAECQAAVVARVWSGRLALPTLHQMQDWQDIILRERGAGRTLHALTPPLDLEYMKEMYDWSKQADGRKLSENGAVGKMPRWWDEELCWLRLTAAEMKKAFNAKGEERLNVLKYEDLNFRFRESD